MLKKFFINREPANPTGSAPTPANPAVPRQPSADELAVDFSDPDDIEVVDNRDGVDAVKADAVKPEVKPKEEPKTEPKVEKKEEVKPIVPPKKVEPKVEVKPEVKPEPKVEKVVAPKADAGPILPPSAQPKARDYSGFSAEETAVLKAMSNDAFNHVSKIIKENKELSKLKDSTFLQHPQAFTLDPQYQNLQTDVHYLRQEANYWQQQLLLIADGKEWRPLEGFDSKTGEPKFGAPQKPTKIDEIQVAAAMNKCTAMITQSEQQLQQFAGNYQQRVKADNAAIQAECSKRFGWVADPKLLDEKITIPEVGEQSIREVHDYFVNLFPPYYRQTPGVDVAAHLYVALQIYAQQIRELSAGKEIAEVKAEEVKRAEPTSEARPPAEPSEVNGVKEFSTELMPV